MPGRLYNSPAEIIAKMMVDLGLGVDPGVTSPGETNWPIYVDSEPDVPDNCITVYNYDGGKTFGRNQITGEIFSHPAIQVRIRSLYYATGYSKADAIKFSLDTDAYRESVTLSPYSYLVQAVTRKTDVIYLGKAVPESVRSIFTLNATVSLRLLS